MARKALKRRSSRVIHNRKVLQGVALALADGTHAVARAIIESAEPPDATPFGEGLVTRGGVLTYVGEKKVDGWGQDGRQPKKPRAIRVKGTRTIMSVAGFGFPARFQEFGTVHHGAQPFLTPTRDAVIPHIPSIMARAVKYRLARLRNLGRA